MTRATGRDELTDAAADAAIEQACRILRLPTIREQHARVAEAAARQKAGYKGFLVELLAMECDEREDRRKTRLIREAGFPRPKPASTNWATSNSTGAALSCCSRCSPNARNAP